MDALLGPYLKKVRTEQKMSLKDISERTRIRTYYLERIEAGDFERLPPGPVSKGFVRAFAVELGEDPDKIIEKYNLETVNFSKSQDGFKSSSPVRSFSPVVQRKGRRMGLPFFVAILFVFLSGFLLWWAKGNADRLIGLGGFTDRIKAVADPALKNIPSWRDLKFTSTKGKIPALGTSSRLRPSADGKEKPLLLKEKSDFETHSATAKLGFTGDTGLRPERGKANGSYELEVVALEDTWFRVVVDEKNKFEMMLAAGEKRQWQGSGKFIITIGNVAGTQISLNGSIIPLPDTSTNVLQDFVISGKTRN
ncbi:MAG: helix-turn-helix domain-containing protein [bacterium]|nr:helix-turn-helix domain-containing protein [bacterium]